MLVGFKIFLEGFFVNFLVGDFFSAEPFLSVELLAKGFLGGLSVADFLILRGVTF